VIGLVSEDWLIVSAIVQAGAAIIIGAFTIALWRSTSRLAEATQRDVELTEQIAQLQTVVLAREAALGAPRLIAKRGDRSITEDHAAGEIRIENIGGSAAYDIEVETSWSTAVIAGPMVPGSKERVTPTISKSEWDTRSDNDPIIQGFRFKDRQGVRWTQAPGEAPVRVEAASG